ncbi:MAG TPA: DUF2933 domain-containing protein [Candidatus Peribacteraceae bacterium]|nr:DUF2933 domain-containing protein [Candidatus Peribacteraceae bacterium]
MNCCSRSSRLPFLLLIAGGIIGLGFFFQWPLITQYWPFFLVFLCPLMHLFAGHNHGEHPKEQTDTSKNQKHDGGSCH